MPVDYYVIIDIRAFERIIDALDGIDIDVEKRMYYEDPWDDDGGLVIDIYPGMQHMTGRKAIQYVRYRDMEGDIGRIRRQQKFMRAVLEKAASPGILPKLPQIIEEVRESVKLLTSDQVGREIGLSHRPDVFSSSAYPQWTLWALPIGCRTPNH